MTSLFQFNNKNSHKFGLEKYFQEILEIFDKNYTANHEIKPDLMLNKPIYVEFTVLELSK